MKRKKIFFSVFFILVTAFCFAQDPQIDSLKLVLSKQKDDSFKVNTLLALGKSYLESKPDEAIKYSVDAKNLAEKIKYPKGIANALKNKGIANYIQAKYLEAIDPWLESFKVCEAMGDKSGEANLLSNMGAAYFAQGDDTKALEFYLKSLKISEEIGDKFRTATVLSNIGSVYYNKPETHDKAIEYYLKSLPLAEELKDEDIIGTVTANIGEIYSYKKDYATALGYFNRSIKVSENTLQETYGLNDIGKVYTKQKQFALAIQYHQKALEIARKFDAQLEMAESILGIADSYYEQGNFKSALASYKQAEAIARKSGLNKELKDAYGGTALAYAKLSDYSNAFKYQTLFSDMKDTLNDIANYKKIATSQFNFDIQKKQSQIDLLTKDKALQDLDLQRQKFAKNALTIGLVLIFIIAFILLRTYLNKIRVNKLLDKQNAEIQSLLLNILPSEVATELQRDGQATPRYYESVSVLFTDFKSFTKFSQSYSAQELVAELNDCFMAFDDIIDKYGLEKIKTIGDSYMCAGGIPSGGDQHYINIVRAGIEIQEYIRIKNQKRIESGREQWDLRIGVHTGPVVAGVVGKKKYAYDIWGGTVNIASRMESNGEPGQVNVSAATYELIKDHFKCAYRGKIYAKNIGEIDMYFVENEIISATILRPLGSTIDEPKAIEQKLS
ncbi:MAG: adenylate/guanylate cyclase domain-containing protein [Bacteroidetes bacterium]|nr:MAG: adenylate/guanylate cyclase domain-containing protein [Bacteroidota bacterium]